jgi:hypothetical protein
VNAPVDGSIDPTSPRSIDHVAGTVVPVSVAVNVSGGLVATPFWIVTVSVAVAGCTISGCATVPVSPTTSPPPSSGARKLPPPSPLVVASSSPVPEPWWNSLFEELPQPTKAPDVNAPTTAQATQPTNRVALFDMALLLVGAVTRKTRARVPAARWLMAGGRSTHHRMLSGPSMATSTVEVDCAFGDSHARAPAPTVHEPRW